eukprot:Skav203317  [mRNA]  locus=scaffold1007:114717:118200:- [translate_table: standard]
MIGPGAGGCGIAALFKVLDPLGKATMPSKPLGYMSFRDVGKLIFPITSKEHKAMCDATSDDEAKSVLYILHFSEPCPQCGFRIQRDSDSAGCPNVICSHCKAPFRLSNAVGYDPMWTPDSCTATNRLLSAVIQTMVRQAATDAAAEDAKALGPKGCPLMALFESLDPTDKGFLLDNDFWQLVQDFNAHTSFDSLCTMVQEVQLRRRLGSATAS